MTTPDRVHLDHAATTTVRPTALAALAEALAQAGADVVLMAKAVDGVYSADPREDPNAELLTEVSHREVIDRGLRVADATAFSLCMDNRMPMLVFNLTDQVRETIQQTLYRLLMERGSVFG